MALNLSSYDMLPPSRDLNSSRACCLPASSRTPSHGPHPHPHLIVVGTVSGTASRRNLTPSSRYMSTVRSADTSPLALGYPTSVMAPASRAMRLMLRHFNASVRLLLLDRRRCEGDSEEGEVAPNVLVPAGRRWDFPKCCVPPRTGAVPYPVALCFVTERLCSRHSSPTRPTRLAL